MAASRDRVEGFTNELRDTYGVAMVDSPELAEDLARIIEREPDWSALPGETPAPIRRPPSLSGAVPSRCWSVD